MLKKKRYKRSIGTETQSQIPNTKKKNTIEKNLQENIEKSTNKSGVVLKPLSKDEQKRILQADSKKEKKVGAYSVWVSKKPFISKIC